MIQKVVKLTDVKKNPNIIIGECVSMVKYGQVVAYVVTPERMEELLYAEEQFVNLNNLEVSSESN